MINEVLAHILNDYEDRLTKHEARITALENALREAQIALPPHSIAEDTPRASTPVMEAYGGKSTGTSGSMAIGDYGWIAPIGEYANIRSGMSTTSIIVGRLTEPQKVIRKMQNTWDAWNWYQIGVNGYVREDVVSYSPDKPAPKEYDVRPVTWARWDSPIPVHYSITNTHHNERGHDGIDLAAERGEMVRCGPMGGVVVKAFLCDTCKDDGDGSSSLNDASKGYGYGSHIIVRYAYDILPSQVKAMIPSGASILCIYAHLSGVDVDTGDALYGMDAIGYVGATGNTYSIKGGKPDHLHLACRWTRDDRAIWSGVAGNDIDPREMFNV